MAIDTRKLTSTRVLVTGGTSGLGLAMATAGDGQHPASRRRHRDRHDS